MNLDAKVYIVLVNYCGYEDTINCIESIRELDYPNYEILVVDNASMDDSVVELGKWAKAQQGLDFRNVASSEVGAGSNGDQRQQASGGNNATRVTLIRCEENLGFAGGNNVGLRYGMDVGDGSFFWLLNNDTTIDVGALKALVGVLESEGARESKVAMCGSVILDAGSTGRIQTLGGSRVNRVLGVTRSICRGENWPQPPEVVKSAEFDYLTGCSILVRSDLLPEIGLLQEDFFMYWEDTEWSFRARKLGFGIAFSPDSIIWHAKGGTSRNYPVMAFYSARNCLRFMREYYPRTLIFCLLGRPFLYAFLAVKHRSFSYFRHSMKGHIRFFSQPGCQSGRGA